MVKDLKDVSFSGEEEEAPKTKRSENIFGPTKREEEIRLHELQKKQREDSLRLLGYDVLSSHCPHCQEKFSLIIADEGKEIPFSLRWLTFLVPRLRRTEVTLHCVSCDRDYKTPSLLAELAIPLLLILFILAVIAGDAILISFLCRY